MDFRCNCSLAKYAGDDENVYRPQFQDYKIAAMEKTIAFPTTSVLNLGSLAVYAAFLLLLLGFIAQLFINQKKMV